jgi:hypothetical protein
MSRLYVKFFLILCILKKMSAAGGDPSRGGAAAAGGGDQLSYANRVRAETAARHEQELLEIFQIITDEMKDMRAQGDEPDPRYRQRRTQEYLFMHRLDPVEFMFRHQLVSFAKIDESFLTMRTELDKFIGETDLSVAELEKILDGDGLASIFSWNRVEQAIEFGHGKQYKTELARIKQLLVKKAKKDKIKADEQARHADEQARRAAEQARHAAEQARRAAEQARRAEEQALHAEEDAKKEKDDAHHAKGVKKVSTRAKRAKKNTRR